MLGRRPGATQRDAAAAVVTRARLSSWLMLARNLRWSRCAAAARSRSSLSRFRSRAIVSASDSAIRNTRSGSAHPATIAKAIGVPSLRATALQHTAFAASPLRSSSGAQTAQSRRVWRPLG